MKKYKGNGEHSVFELEEICRQQIDLLEEIQKSKNQLEKAERVIKGVDDHAESCQVFVFNSLSCTCFYKLAREYQAEKERGNGRRNR